MRRALLFLALLTMLLGLGQCDRPGPTPAGLPSSTSVLGQNLLVKVSGELGYKRPGWKDYLPLSFGIALVRGDLLEVSPGGEGLLVCADLSLAPLEAGYVGGLPCPDQIPVLTRGDSLVLAPQRGVGGSGSIPILLAPRHTFVLDAYPVIRWAVPGAGDNLYTVRVWGADLDWRTETAASEVRYPKDAPPLKAGIPFRITVTDSAGHSSDQEATGLDLAFVLLSPDQVAAVDRLIQQALGLSLDEEGRYLVDAEIYAANGLRADAIATLVNLASREDVPAIDQRLGELYLEIGLYTDARASYEPALAGFRSVGDRGGEAAALVGLGLAQRGDNDELSARESLEQARKLYQDLGDVQGASRVEQVLRDLGGK